jgi:hypothetical protein
MWTLAYDYNREYLTVSINISLLKKNPAFCTMGTGVPFPGSKTQPGCDTDHSSPIVVFEKE